MGNETKNSETTQPAWKRSDPDHFWRCEGCDEQWATGPRDPQSCPECGCDRIVTVSDRDLVMSLGHAFGRYPVMVWLLRRRRILGLIRIIEVKSEVVSREFRRVWEAFDKTIEGKKGVEEVELAVRKVGNWCDAETDYARDLFWLIDDLTDAWLDVFLSPSWEQHWGETGMPIAAWYIEMESFISRNKHVRFYQGPMALLEPPAAPCDSEPLDVIY